MAGQQFQFGSGVLFGRSAQSSTPTPARFGVLQDVSVEFQFTTKPLYGQSQFPVAVGRGTGKISGKAKFGSFSAQLFNDLFFGNTSIGSGEVKTQLNEAKTITANAASASNANFINDLGVTLQSDGSIFTRVSATPVGLQYTCNETTGNYAFNSSQNAVAVYLNYTFNDTANGKTIAISNQLLGNAPTFKAVLTQTYNSLQQTLVLNSCMSEKLALATKLEDWNIPEFDFQAFADAAGNIGTWSQDTL